jgi:hypothetical protein
MSGTVARSILSIALLAVLSAAAPHQAPNCIAQKEPSQQQNGVKVGKAIYFLTNGAENAVVALPIGKDGLLAKGTTTKTNGAGSASINGATKQPAAPDALVAQSSLTIVGNVSDNDAELEKELLLMICRASSQ